MNLAELKKINSNTISQEEDPMANNEASAISEQKSFSVSETQEQIKYLASEMLALGELIRRKLEQDEKTKQELEAKLLENEKASLDLKEKVNKVFKMMNQETKELKETNYKKLETTSIAISEEIRKSQEIYSKFTQQILELAYQVKSIPNPNWKERAKQYGANLLISIGTIALVLGAYQGLIILTKLLKH